MDIIQPIRGPGSLPCCNLRATSLWMMLWRVSREADTLQPGALVRRGDVVEGNYVTAADPRQTIFITQGAHSSRTSQATPPNRLPKKAL